MAQTNQSLVNWIKSKTRSKAKDSDHISAQEVARISRENRRITDALEKMRNRRNVPESVYLTKM